MKESVSNSSKIRVLQIITKPDWAGAQRIVYEISKGIKQHYSDSIDIEVATGTRGPLTEKLKEINVKTHIIPSLIREINPLRDLKAYNNIKRLIKRGNYDVVHCHSTKAGILGRLAAKQLKVRNVIYTVHGWWGINRYKGLKKKIAIMVERFMTRYTDKLVFVCIADREKAVGMRICKPQQCKVILNQVTVPKFEKGKLRKMLGIPKNARIIGNVARLDPQKNPFRFIEVAKNILGKTNNVIFVWIGDGILKDKVKEKINLYNLDKKIILAGFYPNGAELMVDFDCLLMTSDDEGLPITILEAISQKIPVVSTDVGGVSEIPGVITFDKSEFVDKAVNYIQTMLSEKVTKETKKIVVEPHSTERMVKEYINIYHEY